MKKLSLLLTFALILGLLAGCAGTPVVYYSDCTCPTGAHTPVAPTQPPVVSEGAVKTGLYISTGLTGESAGEADGKIEYDVTVAAVTVDDEGVILSCVIDSLGTSITFDTVGVITTDRDAQIMTKNELGDSYGMKEIAHAKYEWYEQAAALANYAVGKTVEQLKNGAVNESGYAADADLATTATIYLGGYVAAIEGAVNNAKHLGAQAGDTLKLSIIPTISSSTDADGETAGNAQLDVDVAALTFNGDIITSCYIDAVQAKAGFDAAGVITSDLTAPVQTKNELGEEYGMKKIAHAKYEWNEQAANFAAYVTGKTAAEVADIAIAEGKPADADLATSVTIAIGGFQALIEKAAQQ